MPKRDSAYMAVQRETIAKAALAVLLRKGVRETTLRDICKEAGISIGALYIHFKTKEEAVAAACQLDYAGDRPPPPRTWAEYVDGLVPADLRVAGSPASKRMRLSLQFVAELTQAERNPRGLSVIYETVWNIVEDVLSRLAHAGEITLPLGLKRTVEVHMQLFAGSRYRLAADRELPIEQVRDALEAALAVTAGRTGAQANTASTRGAERRRSRAGARTPGTPSTRRPSR